MLRRYFTMVGLIQLSMLLQMSAMDNTTKMNESIANIKIVDDVSDSFEFTELLKRKKKPIIDHGIHYFFGSRCGHSESVFITYYNNVATINETISSKYSFNTLRRLLTQKFSSADSPVTPDKVSTLPKLRELVDMSVSLRCDTQALTTEVHRGEKNVVRKGEDMGFSERDYEEQEYNYKCKLLKDALSDFIASDNYKKIKELEKMDEHLKREQEIFKIVTVTQVDKPEIINIDKVPRKLNEKLYEISDSLKELWARRVRDNDREIDLFEDLKKRNEETIKKTADMCRKKSGISDREVDGILGKDFIKDASSLSGSSRESKGNSLPILAKINDSYSSFVVTV